MSDQIQNCYRAVIVSYPNLPFAQGVCSGFPAPSHHFKFCLWMTGKFLKSPGSWIKGVTSKELLQGSSHLPLSLMQDRDCGCLICGHEQMRLQGSQEGMFTHLEEDELLWPEGRLGQVGCDSGCHNSLIPTGASLQRDFTMPSVNKWSAEKYLLWF